MEGQEKVSLTSTCQNLLLHVKSLCTVIAEKNEVQFVTVARETAHTTVAVGTSLSNVPSYNQVKGLMPS